MLLSIVSAFGAGFLGAMLFLFVLDRTNRGRLYSLECDVADLQDRHLRSMRKAAADKRWTGEEELDERIAAVTSEVTAPKKKEWRKWGSKLGSSSADSPTVQ